MTRKRAVDLLLVLLLTGPGFGSSQNQEFSDFTTPLALKPNDTLIIGFVGGWERWDAPQRGVRKTALELRAMKFPRVYVETVENHKRYLASELITKAFPKHAPYPKVILYGQSFGGVAVVLMAQELEDAGIPVELAVLVDAVGRNRPIPSNVREAINFFQRESCPICGIRKISAEDPMETKILGNFQWHSRGKNIDISSEPWGRRFFVRSH
jgi:hypothetical protein